MKMPVVRGVIDRRILVNFRVDPAVLTELLPKPFRPQVVHGAGMAGVCLIRLTHVRPWWLPPFAGITSENAAHRIAVEWDGEDGCRRTGVFIPRRDTSSRINALAGARLFPGEQHHAKFRVDERHGRYLVAVESDDGHSRLFVEGRRTAEVPESSVFGSLGEASDFFEQGSVGYSATRRAGCFDGLELRSFAWDVQPLAIDRVESSYFEDQALFPRGSVAFDCALLMRGIHHEWHAMDSLRTARYAPVNL
ncbi:MAG TPA: DUF2071 domain-containing protein [Gemmataceae bacterium]|jgi:hypothetical protein|nr:DUF2071 domain-containing protein [Gemmataceae bacterium]